MEELDQAAGSEAEEALEEAEFLCEELSLANLNSEAPTNLSGPPESIASQEGTNGGARPGGGDSAREPKKPQGLVLQAQHSFGTAATGSVLDAPEVGPNGESPYGDYFPSVPQRSISPASSS